MADRRMFERVRLPDSPFGEIKSGFFLARPAPAVLRATFHRHAPRVWHTLPEGNATPQESLWDTRTFHLVETDGDIASYEPAPTPDTGETT